MVTKEAETSAEELFRLVGQVETGGTNLKCSDIVEGHSIAADVLLGYDEPERTARRLIRTSQGLEKIPFMHNALGVEDHMQSVADVCNDYLRKKEDTHTSVRALQRYNITPTIIVVPRIHSASDRVKYILNNNRYSAPEVLIERLKKGDLKLPKYFGHTLASFVNFSRADDEKVESDPILASEGAWAAYELLKHTGTATHHESCKGSREHTSWSHPGTLSKDDCNNYSIFLNMGEFMKFFDDLYDLHRTQLA